MINKILNNRKKVLGLNERYLSFIRPYNKRRAIKIADDKVLTKRVLHRHDIPVPKKLGVIKSRYELEHFDFDALPPSFVIKPVHGLMGGGVEIFYNRDKEGKWIKADGSRVSVTDIKAYATDLLDGRYSLFNEPDTILIEERIRIHKNFKYYAYKGAPDVRVIVFNNIPVMSYVRLPTKASDGKANLDKGAVGVAIDMAVGKTTYGILGKAGDIDYTPDYKMPLSGLRIPYWNSILKYAVMASKATNLGFGAIDFLIDADNGPLIVELNARPGLSIQLANHDGLRWRLKKASGIKVKTPEKGMRLAKDLFGGEIEEEIEALSGKEVIGFIENVVLFSKDGKEFPRKAKIDTGATITSIDTELAIKLGYEDAINYAEEILKDIPNFETSKEFREYSLANNLNDRLTSHPDITDTAIVKQTNGVSYRIQIAVNIEISGTVIESTVNLADRTNMIYPVLIGKRDLKKFLIDPSKQLTSMVKI